MFCFYFLFPFSFRKLKTIINAVEESTISVIVTDPHRAWEWEVRSPIFPHVHKEATRSRDPLQLTLRPRSSADISMLENRAEHLGETGLGGVASKTGVWSQAKVDIGVQWSTRVDLVRIGEMIGVTRSAGLGFGLVPKQKRMVRNGTTHKADEDSVICSDGNFPTVIFFDHVVYGSFSVRAERARKSDAFHAIAKE